MARLVLDLGEPRPIFAPPADLPDRIRALLPPDWDLAVVDAPAVGTGDGGDSASAAAMASVRRAEVYFGFGVPRAILRAGPSLRWVHTGTAGVAGSLTPEMLGRDVVFTNSAGVHGPPVAETVLAFILHFARGLDHALAAQRSGRWEKRVFDGPSPPVRELAGGTVGIVGLGGIGREVARRVLALGARVVATRRRPLTVPGMEGLDVLTGPDALPALLDRSDFVVLAVPETPETRGMIGAAALARMRGDAVLINVARGGLVDEAALLEALRTGAIRGAALDVFAVEPLPGGHPFWSAPNLVLTPHISAYTRRFWEREAALMEDNLARYLAGEPLLNVVDKAAGY